VRLRGLGRLLTRPHEQLLVELNNDFNKLKRRLKRVRSIASRLLSKQLQNRELPRRLKVVERPQVLQQGQHHLNHDTAEQSSSPQNIDNYIYQLRPIELNTRKDRDSSDRTWLSSLMFCCCFDVGERALLRAGHCPGQHGICYGTKYCEMRHCAITVEWKIFLVHIAYLIASSIHLFLRTLPIPQFR
jgi:hypothetical protein